LKKIIFIHNNYEPINFPREPDKDDRFYTYGFGSNFARNFKLYYPEYPVEMWRVDGYTGKYYEKKVQNVLFRIFPSTRINRFSEFSFRFLKELRKEVRINSPILFVSNVHTWLLYQIAFFFKKSPIVTTHHGDWSPYFRIKQKRGFKIIRDIVDILIEKIVMKNVDYFLVCDYNQIPYIKKAAPNSKILIHSTGLNIDGFTPIDKYQAREILNWDKNKKYILYVGKLYDIKQSKELIDIWLEIKKNRPEVELVVIGNNKTDEFYEYAVNSGVMTLGRILNKNLDVYYSASDVYVLISLRKDYFGGPGIAPLESLACNTPVVSYSMMNYVGDNMNELGEVPSSLEEYKEGILKVLDYPHLYKNMRESVAKYYTYELISKKIDAVFKELIKTAPG